MFWVIFPRLCLLQEDPSPTLVVGPAKRSENLKAHLVGLHNRRRKRWTDSLNGIGGPVLEARLWPSALHQLPKNPLYPRILS